jgi:dTDP-4-dehydrorhamnose 3,5-epimerase
MRFHQLPVTGVFLVEPERREDERGFFARTWCQSEFAAHELDTRLVQCSISASRQKGTLRGMHYQTYPHPETKVVRCTRGAIYAVVADMRVNGLTFQQYTTAELTDENHHGLYVPAGCAFGFLTLVDNVEVLYQMSEFNHPESARGFRYDDPSFRIVWPEAPAVVSERDLKHPPFTVPSGG